MFLGLFLFVFWIIVYLVCDGGICIFNNWCMFMGYFSSCKIFEIFSIVMEWIV